MPGESASRGVDDNPARNERLADELAVMINRWGELLYVDPASNPNLDFDGSNFGLAGRPIVTPSWLIS
jgi:hypothetical protein